MVSVTPVLRYVTSALRYQSRLEIFTLWFQFFGAVFASKGYPFKNIFDVHPSSDSTELAASNIESNKRFHDVISPFNYAHSI